MPWLRSAPRRIGWLSLDTDPVAKRVTAHFERSAATLGISLSIVRTQRVEVLERAFSELRNLKAQAVLLPPQFYPQAQAVMERAGRDRLPVFGSLGQFADAGGMISLYNDPALTFERAAVMLDKILKGARPADLAVEEPERFVMTVNQRTARAIGIRIPQSVLIRADRVIE